MYQYACKYIIGVIVYIYNLQHSRVVTTAVYKHPPRTADATSLSKHVATNISHQF